MNGDDKTTWFDAELTETGVEQGRWLSDFWSSAVSSEGLPLPQTLYTSPLHRCLQTTKLVFSSVTEERGERFRPIIKEKLRERMTLHTCDYRRPRSWIQQSYPEYVIEEGLSEEDHFGKDGHEETDEEHVARKQTVLEDIFSSDEHEFISLTVHSYAIRAIQGACKAKTFRTREGTSIAMLVKGERLSVD